jgi:hypothetical protein
MPPYYRLRTDGVPVNRPSAFGPGHNSNGASWASIPLKTPVEATGGTMTTYGHPGSITYVGDPPMANYLPSEQIPSRWAPPVAGNQLRVVVTNPPAFMTHTPNNQPEHIPVPITASQSNVAKLKDQLNQRQQAFKGGPRNLATPTPAVRPVFRLYGGGST